MLDQASNKTRIAVSQGLQKAYSGNIDAALQGLQSIFNDETHTAIDRSIAALAIAELYYLDGKFALSREVFDRDINPIAADVPNEIRISIFANRADLACKLIEFEQFSKFYKLSDEMKVAGLQLSDSQELLHAVKQAAMGKSYNSLPVFWRELTRTYKQRVWREFRNASEFMAEECIRIGELSEAAYHACIACSSDIAKQIASTLLSRRDINQISDVVNKLVSTCNLQLHFEVACELVGEIADVVPDCQVDALCHWILARCEAESKEDHDSMASKAWKSLGQFGNRVDESTAMKVLDVAFRSSVWNASLEEMTKVPFLRKNVIGTVETVLPSVPVSCFSDLVDKVIPLVTQRRHFNDFEAVVNLLAHAVHLNDDETVLTTIRNSLYPKGENLPPVLLQLAAHFGQTIGNEDGQLDRYAESIIEILGKTVQRVPKSESVEPIGFTVMTYTSGGDVENVHVHNISTDGIHSIIRNKNFVSAESISNLIQALLSCIGDENNSAENRIAFVECIRGFANGMDRKLALKVAEVFEPIIKQEIDPSKFSDVNHNPLSSYRFSGTTFQQFVGHALFVLALIEKHNPGVNAKLLAPVIEESLSSEWPVVRKGAFAAVRELPTISERLWMPLLLGTRDHNPESACLAFDAISNKEHSGLKRSHWPVLVYSIRLALQGPSVELRIAAAKAVRKLINKAPSKKVKGELADISKDFSTDISYLVRHAIEEGKETSTS